MYLRTSQTGFTVLFPFIFWMILFSVYLSSMLLNSFLIFFTRWQFSSFLLCFIFGSCFSKKSVYFRLNFIGSKMMRHYIPSHLRDFDNQFLKCGEGVDTGYITILLDTNIVKDTEWCENPSEQSVLTELQQETLLWSLHYCISPIHLSQSILP